MKKFILFLSKLLVLGQAKPLKLGLSVAFGILLAFQPINPLSLTTIVLFILLLVLNLNIRLSLVSFAAGMLLAVLLEPVMVLIGSLVLEDIGFLQPLWIMLRNIPVFPLTRFYNTTVAGGFVLALLLFVPLTLLFALLFSKLKKALGEKEEPKELPKPVKLINLALVVSIPVLVLILNYVFLPKFVKDSIEKYGSQAVGAKFELKWVNINFLTATLFFYGLEVTNPRDTMKNIVAIDDIKFKMNVPALLEAKAVIELIEVKNMLFNTSRKTDGALAPAPQQKEQQEETGEKKESGPGEQILNQDFLKNLENFDVVSFLQENVKTTAKIMELKDQSLADMEKWKKEIENFNYHNDLKGIYDEISGLSINPGSFSIEDIQKINQLINTLATSQNKVKTIVNDFNNKQKTLRTDITGTASSIQNIGKAAQEELNALFKMINIKNLDVQELSRLVFSEQISGYIDKGYYWLYKIRGVIPEKKSSVKKEKQNKKKTGPAFGSLGHDVYFPITNARPDFLIRKIFISANQEGEASGYPIITGEVANISSDQDLVGSPLTADVKLKLPGANAISAGFQTTFDRRKNEKIDSYRITISDYALQDLPLLGTGGLPEKITGAKLQGETSVTVLTNRDIDSTVSLELNQIAFTYPEPGPEGQFALIIQEIFSSIDSIEFIIGVKRRGEKTDLAITSNLDSLLRDKLSALLTKKVKELQDKLEKEFNSLIDAKKTEALALLGNKQQEALGLLQGKEGLMLQERTKVENLLKEKTAQLEKKKKELNSVLDKQKNEAENLMQDQLKKLPGLF